MRISEKPFEELRLGATYSYNRYYKTGSGIRTFGVQHDWESFKRQIDSLDGHEKSLTNAMQSLFQFRTEHLMNTEANIQNLSEETWASLRRTLLENVITTIESMQNILPPNCTITEAISSPITTIYAHPKTIHTIAELEHEASAHPIPEHQLEEWMRERKSYMDSRQSAPADLPRIYTFCHQSPSRRDEVLGHVIIQSCRETGKRYVGSTSIQSTEDRLHILSFATHEEISEWDKRDATLVVARRILQKADETRQDAVLDLREKYHEEELWNE